MRVTQRWQRSREIHKPLEEVRSWVMVTNLATQKKPEPRDCKGGAGTSRRQADSHHRSPERLMTLSKGENRRIRKSLPGSTDSSRAPPPNPALPGN